MALRLVPTPGTPPREFIPPQLGFPATLRVSSVDPNTARIAGLTAVTITGTNFLSGATVTFGGTAATNVVVVSATSITCTTPAHAVGAVDVKVTNPGGVSDTLTNGFTYIAGSITTLSPARGPLAGGTTVAITGKNFVTGSTITFGGTAATGVTFIDSQHFNCTTPAHAIGTVDVVITEPAGATVTLSAGFRYTSLIVGSDIRRQPSITIHKSLNQTPHTCTFMIDGNSAPPKVGEDVEVTFDVNELFGGVVQSVEQVFEGLSSSLAWKITAIDYSFLLNKKRPFGTYTNVPANLIAIDLMARFAPADFTTTKVQTNLQAVSITFDGSDDLVTCLTKLAKLIGEGKLYLDRKDLHFFHVAPLARNENLVDGPGTAMTASESATPGSLLPGYYYFQSSFVYQGTAAVFPAVPGAFSPTAPPSTYVLLSTAAATLNLTGNVAHGAYAFNKNNALTFFPRGWVRYKSDGTFIVETDTTAYAGSVTYTSQDVATVLENLAVTAAESELSPISNVVKLTGSYVPAFTGIPIGPAIGGFTCVKRRLYVTSYTETNALAEQRGFYEIANNVDTTLTSGEVPFSSNKARKTLQPPAGPTTAPTASPSATAATLIGGANRLYTSGTWAFKVSYMYEDGTESAPGPASGPVRLIENNAANPPANKTLNWVTFQADIYGQDLTQISFTGTFATLLAQRTAKFAAGGYYSYSLLSSVDGTSPAVHFDGLPIGPSANGVPVIFRKIYASIVVPPPASGTPAFSAWGLDLELWAIVPNNTDTSGDYSGGLHALSVPAGIGSTHVDGPSLETASPPDTLTDTLSTLLHDPPATLLEDASQLRNRIYVKGAGTTLTVPVQAGATSLSVADTTPFGLNGGTLIVGAQVLRYTGTTSVPGNALINLKDVTTAALLSGAPVRVFVQVDDIVSQRLLGAAELDKNGNPTDGIHEGVIDDVTLLTPDMCLRRGLADLEVFGHAAKTLRYATRDPKTKPGQTVTASLTKPPITGDFLITDVTIDQIRDASDTLQPRYTVVARSSPKLTLDDFLVDLDDRLAKTTVQAGVGMQGVTQTAIQMASVAGALTSVTVTLIESQLKTLNSKPVIVIPAPGPGQLIMPIAAIAHTTQTNAINVTISGIQLRYATTATGTAPVAQALLQFSSWFTSGAPTPSHWTYASIGAGSQGQANTDRDNATNDQLYKPINRPIILRADQDITTLSAGLGATLRIFFVVLSDANLVTDLGAVL